MPGDAYLNSYCLGLLMFKLSTWNICIDLRIGTLSVGSFQILVYKDQNNNNDQGQVCV